MSTLEPTTDKLIVQRGSDLFTTTIENMSTIQDTDLLVVGRGSESYKITGQEFMDQVNPPDPNEPPSMTGATLSGTGSGFSGESYTTTLQNYDAGNPEATLGLKAKVTGPFNLVGETSAITGVATNTLQNLEVVAIGSALTVDEDTWDNVIDGDPNTVGKFHGGTPGTFEDAWELDITGYFTSISSLRVRFKSANSNNFSGNTFFFNRDETTAVIKDQPTLEWLDVSDIIPPDGVVNQINWMRLPQTGGWLEIAGFEINGIELVNGTGLTTLTLTDRKDLDNGLFVVGDVLDEASNPTLTSIDPVVPAITVSGGTWSVGQTVKNTVARAPEITPTTDEITGIGTGVDWTSITSIYGSGTLSSGSISNIYDGDVNTGAQCNGRDTEAGFQFTVPAGYSNVLLETRASSGGAYPVTTKVNGNTRGINDSNFIDCSTVSSGDLVQISRGTSGLFGVSVWGIKLGGALLIDNSTALTLASDKDLALFNAGDDVEQDSGYTPQTSAITDVDDTANPSTGTATNNNYDAFSANIPAVFNGSTAGEWAGTDNIKGTGRGPAVSNSSCIRYDFPEAITGVTSVAVYISASNLGTYNASATIINGNELQKVTSPPKDAADNTWVDGARVDVTAGLGDGVTELTSISIGTQSGGGIALTAIEVNGVILTSSSQTTLTLTDDKDLANFRVGDVESQGNTITAIGPGNTLTFDGGSFNIGDTVTGPDTTPATGTVASTDPAAKTMTLSASDESGTKRWIVNAGKTVVGPSGPATSVSSYLTWDNTNTVNGMTSSDPGYAPVTDLTLTFPNDAPTGQTWDQELPAGTYIETRVEATNTEGTADSGWSNSVTPRFMPVGADSDETYAETALRQLTFENRKHVYCAQQVEAQRDQAIQVLAAEGYELSEILKYL